MNRIILASLASVAISIASTPHVLGATAPSEPHHQAHHGHHHPHHHHKMHAEKTSAEMVKESEERLGKLKDTGASLPADLKAEFDINLKFVAVAIEALSDANIKDHKKYFGFSTKHLNAAEHIIKKHEHHLANEKKAAEREAKAQERKERAEARKAKAEERAEARAQARHAKQDAAKAKKEAAHSEQHHALGHGKSDGLDHGKSEGTSPAAPGTEAAKPLN